MAPPLHITIVGPSEKFLSGISYYTIRLSNALAEHNKINALLFRNMLPKKLFPGWKRVGSPLTSLQFSNNIGVRELLDWYNPLTWVRAYWQVKRGNVIIFEWWTSSVAFMYFFIALLNMKRIPLIIEYHEVVDPLEETNFILRSYSRGIGWLIRKLASHFVVHSESDKLHIANSYRIPLNNLTIIPHGLYDHYRKTDMNEARDRLGIQESFIILFFGLLRPYKGLKYLIQAFEALPTDLLERSRLLIVGEPWEDSESLELINHSPHKNKITLIGRYVMDEEINLIFSAASVLVLPYTRASQSGVAHIGMTFGIPIIASRVGGLEESLRHYHGTCFVAPAQSLEISQCLQSFLMTEPHFPVPDNLRWNSIAMKWEEMVTQLVQHRIGSKDI